MAKKKTVQTKVAEVAKKMTATITNVDAEKVQAFKEYLKTENPDWLATIHYSTNTVIDHYRNKSGVVLTKPEYREFQEELAKLDSRFK